MKSEFIQQYAHTWRVFERMVRDFDSDAWMHVGRGTTVPVRISFHVLQGVKYYLEDASTSSFASGKSFETNCWEAEEQELPSQSDILACIDVFREKTGKWLSEMDLDAVNESFEWAGKTKAGIALFLLRHNVYHIGQLSSLLNESQDGDVEGHFVKAIQR